MPLSINRWNASLDKSCPYSIHIPSIFRPYSVHIVSQSKAFCPWYNAQAGRWIMSGEMLMGWEGQCKFIIVSGEERQAKLEEVATLLQTKIRIKHGFVRVFFPQFFVYFLVIYGKKLIFYIWSSVTVGFPCCKFCLWSWDLRWHMAIPCTW